MPTCSICRLGTVCVHAWDRERDALHSDLARVTAERDAHRANADRAAWSAQQAMEERDALRAEVEAMRGVVEAAAQILESPSGDEDWAKLQIALDALRARKVGG